MPPRVNAVLSGARTVEFSGTVYRICLSRFAGNLLSLRGSLLHGARYNTRGYFGALYTSLSRETARQEIRRYFPVPPIDGFVEAAIPLRLNRVVDLTDRALLRKAGVGIRQLTGASYTLTREIGEQAWRLGIEALIVPSAANRAERNLAVFLDNQTAGWRIELAGISAASVFDSADQSQTTGTP